MLPRVENGSAMSALLAFMSENPALSLLLAIILADMVGTIFGGPE